MSYHVLIVDNEESVRFTLGGFLRNEGFRVATAATCEAAVKMIAEHAFDLIIADILPEGCTAGDILGLVERRKRNCPVMVITEGHAGESDEEALRLGAFDCLVKPVLRDDLLEAAGAAVKYKTLMDGKNARKADIEAGFGSAGEALFFVDQDCRIIEINRAAERICGIACEAAGGKSLAGLGLKCTPHCLGLLDKAMARGKTVEARQVHCRRPGGRKLVVTLTASPMRDAGLGYKGALLTVREEIRLFGLSPVDY